MACEVITSLGLTLNPSQVLQGAKGLLATNTFTGAVVCNSYHKILGFKE